jgi:ketosteroid isomerase-like protein
MPEESTTPDREELVRRSIEALNRRDFDALMSLYAHNVVFDLSFRWGGLAYGSREEVRGFIEDWWGPYEDFEITLEEFRDLGDGVTLHVEGQRARLPDSGGFVEQRIGTVATWTDRLIERSMIYTDIDEARTAAERLAEERG